MSEIKPNSEPVTTEEVKSLVKIGYALDMLLEYVPDEKLGHWRVYIKHKTSLVRPLIGVNNKPREFTMIERALAWGKRTGIRLVKMDLHFSEYKNKYTEKD
ncbi:hypothetical protein HF888_16405 (plasmid) [Bermanella marisrubri]|uniref:Uncharacterized protein n=1 Tax=Bermanella marisrubri TaxID=207949 RepID=Q1MY27_9GAMM|nr:hypothetical protein [Bermanella marisrubri]EAT10869.1 hypothetical protein RED65_01983 [Oceanobacter sp. RED65] [Bermanella marisrubri]QIZ85922.1 hypothetical protein HF888_16405 [Bermanella marisrubri]